MCVATFLAIDDVVQEECLYTAWNPIKSSFHDTNQLLFLGAMGLIFFLAFVAGVAALMSLGAQRVGLRASWSWVLGVALAVVAYGTIGVAVWADDPLDDERAARYVAAAWPVGLSDPYACT